MIPLFWQRFHSAVHARVPCVTSISYRGYASTVFMVAFTAIAIFFCNQTAVAGKPGGSTGDPSYWECSSSPDLHYYVTLDGPTGQRTYDPCEIASLTENDVYQVGGYGTVNYTVHSHGWTSGAANFLTAWDLCTSSNNQYAQSSLTMEVSGCYVVEPGQPDPSFFHPEMFSRTPIPSYNRPAIRFISFDLSRPPVFNVIQWTWPNPEICQPGGQRDPSTGKCLPPPTPQDEKGNGTGSPKEPKDDLTQGTPANAVANAVPRVYGDPCHYGNPCNPANGNKHQSEEDYRTPATGLSFIRTYNSRFGKDIGLGYGWISSMHTQLEIAANSPIIVRRLDGRGEPFSCGTKGACKGDVDTFLILTKDASGYTLTHPQGISERFNTAGRLTTKTYPAGTQLSYSYNAQGRVASVTGPFGHTLNFAYDAQGHLATVTYPDGQASQYEYDASNNLVRVTYPDGRFKTYHYENAQFPHHLTGITDENGVRVATYGYDTLGRAVLTEHAQTDNGSPQERFLLGYPSATEAIVQDAIGSQDYMQFQINLGVKNMVYKRGPDGKAMAQTFDANNNVLSRTDEEGRITTYTYNAYNQLVSMTEASGTAQSRTTTYKYLSTTVDVPTQISRPSLKNRAYNLINISYNSKKDPITITQSGYTPSGTAISRTVALAYNSFGQVISIDGPRTDVNDVTTYAYYECTTGGACGHLSSVTDPLGHVTSFSAYDAHGRVLEMTDPNGLKTNYVYDLRGRVLYVTQTLAGGISRTTQFFYDNAGNLVQVINPDGMTLVYTYDAANYLRTVTDNLGNRVAHFYDLKGNRTRTLTSDPDGTLVRSIENAYDVRNRVSQINESGAVTQFSWDGVGNLVFESNPRNFITRYVYDALDRLQQGQYPSGIADYGYDVNDNPTQVTAPNGAVTGYVHDDLGNRLQETSPDRGTMAYTHDAAGNVKTATDARGVTVAYTYDALNRLVNVDYPGTAEDVTYAYDNCTNGAGRTCAVQDAGGSTSYTYDGFGNVTEMRRTELGVVYTTRYVYDAANRITSMTYPDGRVVSYTRDAIGRVTAVTTPVNGLSADLVSNRFYRADQLVKSQTFGNSLAETRDYDLRGQLLNQYLGAADTWVYSYDANGNLTNLQTLPQVYTYEYDVMDRIKRTLEGPILEIGTPYINYSYDANGNRLSDNQGAYNYVMASNRLTATPYGSITLDPAGNTLTAGTRAYSYNNAGQLAEARLNGALQASYLYNAQGSRTRKSVPSGTTVYHYDLKGRLIEETKSDGTILRAYVWTDEAPLAQIDRNLLGQETVVYLHTDHQGTPRLATNATGTVVWRWVGSAFGDVSPNEDPDNDGSLTTVNLRYPGLYFDSEMGLHYNWHRYYDPKMGRYLTSDRIGLRGGLNTYAYVLNNPLRWVDPRGTNATAVWGAEIGSVFGPVGTVVGGAVGFGIGLWVGDLIIHSDTKPAGNATDSPAFPDTPLPSDPNISPGEGWEWRGSGSPESGKGNYWNPATGQSLHPDLSHPEPKGSHWGLQNPDGTKWDWFPDKGWQQCK